MKPDLWSHGKTDHSVVVEEEADLVAAKEVEVDVRLNEEAAVDLTETVVAEEVMTAADAIGNALITPYCFAPLAIQNCYGYNSF